MPCVVLMGLLLCLALQGARPERDGRTEEEGDSEGEDDYEPGKRLVEASR